MRGYDVVNSIYRLDHVDRWAGLYVTQKENVAQHSYHVACIAGILAIIEKEVFHKNIDMPSVIMTALLHDISDSKLTHITYEARTTSKEFSNAVKNIQREVWHNLVEKDSEVKNNFQPEQYIKMDDTIKYLIESADTIDAMCFAKREVKRSNMEFVPILKRQTKKLQELKMKYPCIEYFETYILRELLRTI